jgi:nucleotide-binding universal stress UspA family protein
MRPRFAPRTEIDGFRLVERLHQGSMSAIWRVTRAADSASFAMKIPFLAEGGDPAAIVGFEVEQMILPTMSGGHVPHFVASGDWATQPYIVMELLPGQSLRARLVDAPLHYAEVASIGARVAAALHDIHSQHVIHLDLKPSNILFREGGEAVLIDFGLSRHDRLPDLLAEEFRLPMGTAPYISPEQVRHIRSEPRSDLFALGAVLYHLTTGQRAFGNPTTVRGLRQRLYRDPIPPRARTPTCPPWLQEVILRCLEVEPRNRYETAAQLAFDLQNPHQIVLTSRADRTSRSGMVAVWRRRLRALGAEPPEISPTGFLSRAPIILVAVDLLQRSEALSEELRLAAGRVLRAQPGARLAFVTVMKTRRIGMDTTSDEEGRNIHVQRLVELKHWARPLGIPPARVTYHVLEAPDPAAAIVEFAQTNHAEQIVIGSRGSSTLRRYLGSVSSQVVAEADCTVIVVKAAERGASGQAADASASGADAHGPMPSDIAGERS